MMSPEPLITPLQKKMIWTVWHKISKSKDRLYCGIINRYGRERMSALTRKEASDLIHYLGKEVERRDKVDHCSRRPGTDTLPTC